MNASNIALLQAAHLASTLAVVKINTTATTVSCTVYTQTQRELDITADFNGSHAEPYITNVRARIPLFIGDSVNCIRGDLADDAAGFALAIEQAIVDKYLRQQRIEAAGDMPF